MNSAYIILGLLFNILGAVNKNWLFTLSGILFIIAGGLKNEK